MNQLEESTQLWHNTSALKEKLREEGYLLFREILDLELIREVRNRILDLLWDQDWIDKDFPRAAAKCKADVPIPSHDPRFVRLHTAILSLEEFHRVPFDKSAIELIERLLDDEVIVHPRRMARVVVPSTRWRTVPVHQDYTYVGGSVNFLSAWIPLKDVPIEQGALRILTRSHTDGLHETTDNGKEKGFLDIPEDHPGWLVTDYKLGDIIIFPPTTIHGATDNHSDSIRLSMDVRYQGIREPILKWQTQPPYQPYLPLDWSLYTNGWANSRLVALDERCNVVDSEETVPVRLPISYKSKFF